MLSIWKVRLTYIHTYLAQTPEIGQGLGRLTVNLILRLAYEHFLYELCKKYRKLSTLRVSRKKFFFCHNSRTINISGNRTCFVITIRKSFFGHNSKTINILCKRICFVITMKKLFFWSYLLNYQHFGQNEAFL